MHALRTAAFASICVPLLVAQEPAWVGPVRAAIEAKIAADRIPGLSCAIAVGAGLPFRAGFGLACVENDVPATPQTVYRLASISKPITAVLALQLAEAGRLDLDADVATLVPAWPQKQWPVTTRQLLGHLGGVRHYRGERESTVHFATQAAGLVRFAGDALLHEPGTKYLYSTYGYNLAAAVVEQAAGRPFSALVRERIADACAAPTLQDDDPRRIIRGRAQGYVRRQVDGVEVLQNSELMDASYKLGGGGLCASAEDLARFGAALLAGRLLRPETLAVAWTEQQTRDGAGTGYGLGFRVDTRSGRRTIGHSGAQSRVSTMLLMLPEQQVVVVLLCNLQGVRLGSLAQQIVDLVAPPPGK